MAFRVNAGAVVGAGVIGGGLLLGLVGCSVNGPFALGVKDGDLVVAVCRDAIVTQASVSEHSRPEGNKQVWEASGRVGLSRGDWLVVSQENVGLVNEKAIVPTITTGETYSILMLSDQYSPDSAAISIPEGGLVEGTWVTNRGAVSDVPCVD